MRLFVGINLNARMEKYVRERQKILAATPHARLTPARHLHLTLAFVGEVEQATAEKISAKLQTLSFSPFRMYLTGLSYFGPQHKPRVVWLGVEPQDMLCSLKQRIHHCLEGYLPAAPPPFHAHITLGRIKQIRATDKFTRFLASMEIEPLGMQVNNLSLMASDLTGPEPVYTEITRIPPQA